MQFEYQQYQEDCVNNIVRIAEEIGLGTSTDYSSFVSSVDKIKAKLGYTNIPTKDNKTLDVMMETGTGKTFTYIKTMFELNKFLNFKKFIIVCPRSAIKLGIIQQINLTKEYFFGEYKTHLNYINYPDAGLGAVREHFVQSNDFSVLITNYQALTKDTNINKLSESLLLGKLISPLQALTEIAPVVIMDEPHLLKGEETTTVFSAFNTSLFIRFGATYPLEETHQLSNLVYGLDSISSFKNYLVKKIRVHNHILTSEQGAVSVSSIEARHKRCTVVYDENQEIKRATLMKGDDVGAKTGLEHYHGVAVTKINSKEIFFGNGTSLKIKTDYELQDEEIRMMIRTTIKTHFEKEQELFDSGIKVLSLFFIPHIADFRGNNPRVKNIFEEEYPKIRKEFYDQSTNQAYTSYLEKDYIDGVLQVHEGYFSGDKGNREEKETAGINLILNEKEKLLSFDTSLRFVFSVWALQEGWDNPNIFNICKIASTNKEISRRQQVGRGLRLAVNQHGRRLTHQYYDENKQKFYETNTLDVIVSSYEKDFISKIQEEIQTASFSLAGDRITLSIMQNLGLSDAESAILFHLLLTHNIITYGTHNDEINEYIIQSPIGDFIREHREQFSIARINDERYNFIMKCFAPIPPQAIESANQHPKKVKIRNTLLQEFKELWETINTHASFSYDNIDEATIINAVKTKFDSEIIDAIQMSIETKEFNAQTNSIEYTHHQSLGEAHFYQKKSVSDFVQYFIREEKLPIRFVIKLFNVLDKGKISKNPKVARERICGFIKEAIHSAVLQAISYQFENNIENDIKITSLQNQDGSYVSEIDSKKLGRYSTQEQVSQVFLYDTICYDSQFEKDIMQNDPTTLDDNHITVFAKLPRINIPTPYKKYNPDFAYLVKKTNGEKLFLVVESKGYHSYDDIDIAETQKIAYAEKFFRALQLQYPDLNIHYESRINRATLLDVLHRIVNKNGT